MPIPTLKPPLLFVSDAHLGGFSIQKNNRIETELIQLINYCQQNKIHMAILGDLFDYWMEYPKHIPTLGRRVLNRFEDFNKTYGPTLYVTGNHDHWTNYHLQERGFCVEHNQFVCSINDRRVMVLHGEGLTDESYHLQLPLLHRFIRHDRFIRTFQTLLPAKAGITVMKYFSRFSRYWGTTKENPDKLNHWAKKQLKKKDYDLIICGHDHVARREQFAYGTYINLGTFFKHRTMAFYNNNAISLVSWDAKRQSIKPFESTSI